MLSELRSRAAHLLLAVALLVVLAPTPRPGALVERLQRGITALSGGRGESALEDLQAALNLVPGLESVGLAAARAAWAAGDPPRTLSLLAGLPPGPAAACLRAEVLLHTGEHERGLALLAGSPPACPAEPVLLGRLAQALLSQRAWDPAERVLEIAVARDPGAVQARTDLGMLLVARDPQSALEHLRRAEQLAPQTGGPRLQLIQAIEDGLALGGPPRALGQAGQALAAAGRWELARRALEAAVAADPRAAGVRALLGVTLDHVGEDGGDQIRAAVELAPESTQVQLLAARHWRGVERMDQALAALEAAARLDPADPAIASELASLYLALGDLRSAEAAYSHAVSAAPDDPLFWGLLAGFSLEHEVNLRGLGLPAARRAAQLAPRDPQVLDRLAACHYLLGSFRLADRLAWRALQLDPGLAAAHYHRGLALLALGDRIGAVQSLQQAQTLDPEGRIGELANRSLANLPP